MRRSENGDADIRAQGRAARVKVGWQGGVFKDARCKEMLCAAADGAGQQAMRRIGASPIAQGMTPGAAVSEAETTRAAWRHCQSAAEGGPLPARKTSARRHPKKLSRRKVAMCF